MQPKRYFRAGGCLGTPDIPRLCLTTVQGFRAAFGGQVAAKDFLYEESSRVPDWVSLPKGSFMNLLQVPILFA